MEYFYDIVLALGWVILSQGPISCFRFAHKCSNASGRHKWVNWYVRTNNCIGYMDTNIGCMPITLLVENDILHGDQIKFLEKWKERKFTPQKTCTYETEGHGWKNIDSGIKHCQVKTSSTCLGQWRNEANCRPGRKWKMPPPHKKEKKEQKKIQKAGMHKEYSIGKWNILSPLCLLTQITNQRSCVNLCKLRCSTGINLQINSNRLVSRSSISSTRIT